MGFLIAMVDNEPTNHGATFNDANDDSALCSPISSASRIVTGFSSFWFAADEAAFWSLEFVSSFLFTRESVGRGVGAGTSESDEEVERRRLLEVWV